MVDGGTQTDERGELNERLVARTLQAGLAVGLSLMTAGWLVDVATVGLRPDAVRFGDFLHPMSLGTRLGALGVLALGLTPASRVTLLVVLWARERDWRFVGVAATVLVVLTAALFAGVG